MYSHTFFSLSMVLLISFSAFTISFPSALVNSIVSFIYLAALLLAKISSISPVIYSLDEFSFDSRQILFMHHHPYIPRIFLNSFTYSSNVFTQTLTFASSVNPACSVSTTSNAWQAFINCCRGFAELA